MQKEQNVGHFSENEKKISENVRHFVRFAYIKNRMICAIAINVLNRKPFDFFVSDDPSPRFH